MTEVVKKLADEKGFDMVVDMTNIIFSKPALEITNDAIAAYDKITAAFSEGYNAPLSVTADVIDWCMLVGERIAPDAIHYEVDGDPVLGRDLVTAAPALAI